MTLSLDSQGFPLHGSVALYPPLLDDESSHVEVADHDVHAVAGLDLPSTVGEGHPVGLTGFDFAGRLTQLANLFHGGDDQLQTALGAIQLRIQLLVHEGLGFHRIEDAIGKANQLSGLDGPDAQRVNAPYVLVVSASPFGETIGLEGRVNLGFRGRGRFGGVGTFCRGGAGRSGCGRLGLGGEKKKTANENGGQQQEVFQKKRRTWELKP